MDNPYGNNVNPSQYAAWEHGRKAGKAEQTEIVSELVRACESVIEYRPELEHASPAAIRLICSRAAEALAKATGI